MNALARVLGCALLLGAIGMGCSEPTPSSSGTVCVPGSPTICDASLTKILSCHATGSSWILLGPDLYCAPHEICNNGSAGAVCVDRLTGQAPEIIDATGGGEPESDACEANCPDAIDSDAPKSGPTSDTHCVESAEFLTTSQAFLSLFEDGATTCNFDQNCIQEQLSENVEEITPECAGCFAALAACAKEGECSAPCTEGLLSTGCITCLAIDGTCKSDFVNCSGLNGIESDDDGWMDAWDNCPHMANNDQSDADRDGAGDRCDDSFTPPEEKPESCTSDADCICEPCIDGSCQGDGFNYPTFGCAASADCPEGEQCFQSFPPASPCLNQCIPDGTTFNSCCHIHAAAGCADLQCEELVCAEPGLSYCCEESEDPFIWDAGCAKKAKIVCEALWGISWCD